jgi:hypothetical protein
MEGCFSAPPALSLRLSLNGGLFQKVSSAGGTSHRTRAFASPGSRGRVAPGLIRLRGLADAHGKLVGIVGVGGEGLDQNRVQASPPLAAPPRGGFRDRHGPPTDKSIRAHHEQTEFTSTKPTPQDRGNLWLRVQYTGDRRKTPWL